MAKDDAKNAGGSAEGAKSGKDQSAADDKKDQGQESALAQQVKDLTEKLDDSEAKTKRLSTQLGTQSSQMESMNKFANLLDDDFEGTMKAYADKHGRTVNFGDGKGDDKLFSGDDDDVTITRDKLNKLVSTVAQNVEARLENRMSKRMGSITYDQMAQRHVDWDDLVEQRTAVVKEMQSGSLSIMEAAHLIVRGRMLPDVANALREKSLEDGREEGRKDTERKAKTGLSDAATGGTDGAPPSSGPRKFTEIVDHINKKLGNKRRL